jgi:hypothetical protein
MDRSTVTLLDPARTAAELGINTGTLAMCWVTRDGPPFHRVGARIRYSRADLDRWLTERRVRSTSDHK